MPPSWLVKSPPVYSTLLSAECYYTEARASPNPCTVDRLSSGFVDFRRRDAPEYMIWFFDSCAPYILQFLNGTDLRLEPEFMAMGVACLTALREYPGLHILWLLR